MRECIIVLGMCLVCVTFVASLEWAATWARYPWPRPKKSVASSPSKTRAASAKRAPAAGEAGKHGPTG